MNRYNVIDPAMLLESFDEPIVIHRSFLRITGAITPALFLTWAITLTRELPDSSDGWLKLTQSDWTVETGLSRWEQESARKQLRTQRFIEERRVGMPARLELRVNAAAISEAMRELARARYQGFLDAHDAAQSSANP